MINIAAYVAVQLLCGKADMDSFLVVGTFLHVKPLDDFQIVTRSHLVPGSGRRYERRLEMSVNGTVRESSLGWCAACGPNPAGNSKYAWIVGVKKLVVFTTAEIQFVGLPDINCQRPTFAYPCVSCATIPQTVAEDKRS